MSEENVPLHRQSGCTKIAWKPGGFRHFPYIGYLSLVASVACTGVATFLIIMSDGQLVSHWYGPMHTSPSVLLALTSALANIMMLTAYAEGWVLFFWIQALKGNMPLSNIHYNWEAATSAWGSFKSLMKRRALSVSVVSLLVAATATVRGPLIQKSVYIQTRDISLPGSHLPLQVCPTTEIWLSGSPDHARFRRIFSDVMRDYQARAPIYLPGSEYCTNCTLTVKALGFNYSEPVVVSNKYKFFERPPAAMVEKGDVREINIFEVHTTAVDNGDHLNVSVSRKTSEGCEAEIVTTSIRLYPSTVEYNLFVHQGEAIFQGNDSMTNNSGTVWSYIDYIGAASFLYERVSPNETASRCGPAFDDPLEDILRSYGELALRLSIHEGTRTYQDAMKKKDYETARTALQEVNYKSHQYPTEYAANKVVLCLAVACSLMGPAAILFLFNGWQTLGRKFSFSPFELANSFLLRSPPVTPSTVSTPHLRPISSMSDANSIFEQKQRQHQLASLLANCSSNASAQKLVKSIRQGVQQPGGNSEKGMKTAEPVVQYGVLDGTGLLGFAISDANGVVHARPPRKNEML
ncbi:hypothetical protein B0T20DRAFT_360744 [Sordaria brevicollis]|uniref:Uncharacterized protein n=1 Tax=Sordaria brevicollis TaxID=83679 RepID=A0AAE0U6B6_SORBR|nr:hypothetical protein B0T20DRAFT_360744 [Sordaria brevicollis]